MVILLVTTKARAVASTRVLRYSRSVYYSTNGTWIYVTRAAEYCYYITTLVKPFTNWQKCDLKKRTWPHLGGGGRPTGPTPAWLRACIDHWHDIKHENEPKADILKHEGN